MAAPTPSGSTITNVARTIYTVLRISGRMPMRSVRWLGLVERNSQLILGIPLYSTYPSRNSSSAAVRPLQTYITPRMRAI